MMAAESFVGKTKLSVLLERFGQWNHEGILIIGSVEDIMKLEFEVARSRQ